MFVSAMHLRIMTGQYYTNVLFASDSQLSFIGRDDFDLNGETISSTDYTRRRWLDKDLYGTILSANYQKEYTQINLGGGYYIY